MFEFEAIGTHWQIDISDLPKNQDPQSLLTAIKLRIQQFEKNYSRFLPTSLVSRMSRQLGKYGLPEDASSLLQFYHQLYHLTDGQVTPFIGQTLVAAGYDSSYSLIPRRLTTPPPKWEDAIEISQSHLHIKTPFLFDFGAAGKGYLIDLIATLLEKHSLHHYVIDAGGDILVHEDKPLTIGLENPFDTSEAIGQVSLNHQAIAASAGNRRQWSTFHHIINPHTLTSPPNITASWVVADRAIIADGLATALFFTEPDTLMSQFKFEYLLLYPDHSAIHSPYFPGTLY